MVVADLEPRHPWVGKDMAKGVSVLGQDTVASHQLLQLWSTDDIVLARHVLLLAKAALDMLDHLLK